MHLENTTILGRIRGECRSFFEAVANSRAIFYFLLLLLHLISNLIPKLSWAPEAEPLANLMRHILQIVVVYGTALYLGSIIFAWKGLRKKPVWLVLVSVALLGLCLFYVQIRTSNSYGAVFDIVFGLLACGKDYRKILRCVMYATLAALIVAFIGVFAGFTWNMRKPETLSQSLGINYPNTWGYMAFLVIMILWYLRLRNRPVFTFVFFWGVGLFMYFFIICRTISALCLVFPLAATGVDWLERRADKTSDRVGIFGWIITFMPFLVLAFVLIVSSQYVWIHKHFIESKLFSFAYRFIANALFIRTFGVPVFGNTYRPGTDISAVINGEMASTPLLDCSYTSFLIMRGAAWVLYTLGWMCFAIRQALKRRDYAIPFLSAIILVFAMMERPGLELWYNFILLYPLAKIVDPTEKGARKPRPWERPNRARPVHNKSRRR